MIQIIAAMGIQQRKREIMLGSCTGHISEIEVGDTGKVIAQRET